ncbi:hypothetical protein ACLOJK_039969 [Asimina triloba]
MGRRLPIEVNHSSIQPAISLALLVAWMAALVAVVTALCGVRSKKSSTPKSSQHRKSPSFSSAQGKGSEEPETTTTTAATETTTAVETTTEETPGPLPLPPALQRQAELEQKSAASSPRKPKDAISFPWRDDHWGSPKSRLGMMGSLSMRLPDTLSRIKTGKEILRRKLHGDGDKGEDSLWTKTIMLGEKNRVPNGIGGGVDNDENNNVDDKGNRTTVFPSITPRSLPASRSSSYIDPKAVPTRKL